MITTSYCIFLVGIVLAMGKYVTKNRYWGNKLGILCYVGLFVGHFVLQHKFPDEDPRSRHIITFIVFAICLLLNVFVANQIPYPN